MDTPSGDITMRVVSPIAMPAIGSWADETWGHVEQHQYVQCESRALKWRHVCVEGVEGMAGREHVAWSGALPLRHASITASRAISDRCRRLVKTVLRAYAFGGGGSGVSMRDTGGVAMSATSAA